MPLNSISGASCSIYPVNHPTLPTGLPAQEYKHHAIRSSTTGAIQEIVTIESNDNTAFEIKLDIAPTAYSLLHQTTDHPPNRRPPRLREDDYLIFVDLDGINAQRSKRHRSQKGPTRISRVYSTDLKTSRLFQFGQLQLVDPDENNGICQDEEIIQSLGTIKVSVVRCSLSSLKPVVPTHETRPNSNQRPPPYTSRSTLVPRNIEALQTTNQMIFSEHTKKACQLNTAGLSKPIPAPRGGHAPFRAKKKVRHVLTKDPSPFLQFIFHYKPRSILAAEGIIAPPSPPPSRTRPTAATGSNKTRQPSVKNDTSNTQGYTSNSELHGGLHDLDEKKLEPKDDEEDVKKPNLQPDYIVIDSDSEKGFSETKETKAKVMNAEIDNRYTRGDHVNDNKTRLNRSVGGIKVKGAAKNATLKLENDGQDENHPQLVDDSPPNDQHQTSDSKKRIRPSTNYQPNKRRSSIIVDSNNSHENDVALSRHVRLEEEETNDTSSEDSSDDDYEFQNQIIGSTRTTLSEYPSNHLKVLNRFQRNNQVDSSEGEIYEFKSSTTATLSTNSRARTFGKNSNGQARYNDVKHRVQNGIDVVDLTEVDID